MSHASRGFANYDRWKLSNAEDEQDAMDRKQWFAKSPEEREQIERDLEDERTASDDDENDDADAA